MAACLSCGQENPAGALFCVGCGSALGTSCASCGRPAPPAARFCPSCGAPFAPARPTIELRKTVTVVFVDVVGSTPLGESLDPESLRRLMARFLEEAERVFRLYGGSVVEFSGDAVLAVFGIPSAHEDDAYRAVRAAVAMRDAMSALNTELERELNVSLSTRTGINTGEVLAGDPLAGQPIVVGDAVNVAARLERIAPEGEILMGAETRRFVGEAVIADELDPLPLKGKSDTVPAWRVIGTRPGSLPRRKVPMVGRRRELDLMRHVFERAVEARACHLITVLGQPGVGKSRLVEEFADDLGSRARVLTGRSLPYGEGITFWPITEVVQQAASISAADPIPDARRKVASLFDGEESVALGNVIAQTVGLAEQRVGKEQIFWAVRRLFQSLARKEPCVVVFDDIHWAEETFLDLLDHLTDATQDAAVTLVCVARDDLLEMRPTWGGGKANAATLALTPLDETDASRLLDETVSGTATEAARDRILELAGGNALYLEEMTASLIEDGSLVRVDGRWDLVESAQVVTPPSIQSLLAARLDHLSDDQRQVIGAASVAGKVFSSHALRALLPEDLDDPIGEILTDLVRRGLVQGEGTEAFGGDSYSFRHILIRDAAYETLPKDRRAQLHQALAEWMTATLGSDERGFEEIVGYHFEQAHDYLLSLGSSMESRSFLGRKAFDRLSTAGEKAFARGDYPAAVSLLERSQKLLPRSDPSRWGALPTLGRALTYIPDFDRAQEILSEAIELGTEKGDVRVVMLARLEEAVLQTSTEQGNLGQVLDVARDAVSAFETLQDDKGLAAAWHVVGWASAELGQMQEGATALSRAIEHAGKAGALILEARCRWALLGILQFGPFNVTELTARAKGDLAWADSVGDSVLEGFAIGSVALAKAISGEAEEALRWADRYEDRLKDLGSDLRRAWAGVIVGLTCRLCGELERADRTLAEACATLQRLSDKWALPTTAGVWADVLLKMGRTEEASRALALCDSAQADDVMPQIDSRRVRARLMSLAGKAHEAESMARDAIRVAERSDYLISHADAWTDLAEILARSGSTKDAKVALSRAKELHRLKGNVSAEAEAERRVAALL